MRFTWAAKSKSDSGEFLLRGAEISDVILIHQAAEFFQSGPKCSTDWTL